MRDLDLLEGALEGLDDVGKVPEVVLEVALMVKHARFSLSVLLVSVDAIGVDVVDEVRPPTQGERLVGIFDNLRLRAQLWELDVYAQNRVNFSEGVQTELADAAPDNFASS